MARSLNKELLEMMTTGKYKKVIETVRNDRSLSFEIRDGKGIIYYKKGKVLTLAKDRQEEISSGYDKYGSGVPKLDLQRPKKYFDDCKTLIDNYAKYMEFTMQQMIASQNVDENSEFLVIDMEYQYEQKDVPADERIDKTRIDLVAIELATKAIVLFELKQGCGALEGRSGIEDHIKKTQKHIDTEDFCKKLRRDIKAIIGQKVQLGMLDEYANKCIEYIDTAEIKMMFIFVYSSPEERMSYDKMIKDFKNNGGSCPQTHYFNMSYKLSKNSIE